jgi:hypothetical protein
MAYCHQLIWTKAEKARTLDLWKAHLALLLYTGAAASTCQIAFSAVEYLGEGTVQYVYFGPSMEILGETERHFSFGVVDGRWAVHTELNRLRFQGQPLSTEKELSLSSWTDGSMVYQLHRFNTNFMSGRNEASAVIHPGEVPVGFNQMLHDLWIGLGSAAYFQSLGGVTEGFVFPLVATPDQAEYSGDFRVCASWRLQPTEPYLPIEVAFTESRADRVADPSSTEPSAFTNSHFLVESWTNLSGLKLPRSFTVRHFVLSNEEPLLRARSEVTVTNYHMLNAQAFFDPPLPGQTLVRDNRFLYSDGARQSDHFTYWISNRWLSPREVRHAYAAFNLAATDAAQPGKRLPHWVVVAFGVLATASLVLIVRKARPPRPSLSSSSNPNLNHE